MSAWFYGLGLGNALLGVMQMLFLATATAAGKPLPLCVLYAVTTALSFSAAGWIVGLTYASRNR